ncbi:hypothetical protein VCB98_06140 [Gammaproteobacteria bacterium AB-CW1]|uniref:Extradiol ring-cleavage dioxygenase LigAB LigA subunit domain-containing protein n=1 Tax=Natronospira elongata TaxID=3110268 RepID=A0AAP6MJV3_9GAMM|nr:hypothetical protein [Gammaproteobacteria bacterium AB-CW1]
MSKLADLIHRLGEDAELESRYEKDPEAVMAEFELSEEEKKALAAGDLDEIRRLTGLSNIEKTSRAIIRSYD